MESPHDMSFNEISLQNGSNIITDTCPLCEILDLAPSDYVKSNRVVRKISMATE